MNIAPWLLVGLGNPGPFYHHHRHNIGFFLIEKISKFFNCTPCIKKNRYILWKGSVHQQSVFMLQPLTYMNLAGKTVAHVKGFYRIPSDNILVIHDDIDLCPGTLRFKKGGGAGGHNGLRSIDSHCEKEYWRLRVGVGRPLGPQDVASYVLEDFFPHDHLWINLLTEALQSHVHLFFHDKQTFYTSVKEYLQEKPTKQTWQ